MTTNHKPATALPGIYALDGVEIARHLNAYPRLVEALRNLRAAVQRGVFDDIGPDIQPDSVAADALLRELGE